MNVGVELYGRTCGRAYYTLIRTLLEPQYRTIGSANYSEAVGLQLIIKEPQYNLVASRNRPVDYISGFELALDPALPNGHFFEQGDSLGVVVQFGAMDAWLGFVEPMQAVSYRAALHAAAHKTKFDTLVLQIGQVYLRPEDHKAALNFVCYDANVNSLESPMPGDPKVAAHELMSGDAFDAINNEQPARLSIAGLKPIYAAIMGDRDHAPAVLNDLYYNDYGTGWPASGK